MELPVDVSQNDAVTNLLNEAMESQGIDAIAARQNEQTMLLRDAKQWQANGRYEPVIDPRTGASPIHVAACKDYTDVLEVLLKLPGVNVNCQDNDGWTPLHAAAHWNREQSARLLVEAGASFDTYTHTNQSIFDVADKQITILLRQLRERQRGRAPPTPVAPVAPVQTEPAAAVSSDESSESEESEESIEEKDEEEEEEAKPPISLVQSTSGLAEQQSQALTAVAGGDVVAESKAAAVSIPSISPTDVNKPTEKTHPGPVVPSWRKSPPLPIGEPDVLLLSQTLKRTSPPLKPKEAVSKDTQLDRMATDSQQSELNGVPEKPTGLLESSKASEPPNDSSNKPETSVLTNGSPSERLKSADSATAENQSTVSEFHPNVSSAVTTRQRRYSRDHSPPPPPTAGSRKVTFGEGTTVNSSRIVTIRKRQPGTVAVSDSRQVEDVKRAPISRSPSPKLNDDVMGGRRISLLMSPAKSVETETQRSVKARYVRSTRRSTQGVSAEEVEEAKKLICDNKNNSAAVQLTAQLPSTNTVTERTRAQPSGTEDGRTTSGYLSSLDRPISPDSSVGRASDALESYRYRRTEGRSGLKDSAAPSRLRSREQLSTSGTSVNSLSSTNSSITRQPGIDEYPSTASQLRSTAGGDGKHSDLEASDSVEHLLRQRRRFVRGLNSPAYSTSETLTTPSCTVSSSVASADSSSPVVSRPFSRFLHSTDSSVPQQNHVSEGLNFPWNSARTSATPSMTTSLVSPFTSNSSVGVSGTSDSRGSTTYRDRLAPSAETTDYRRLYEAEKAEKDRLMRELDRITKENANLRLQLTRLNKEDSRSGVNSLNSTAQVTDEELNRLREENAKMKEENGALIRVISKLSKPV
ncbi:hypothetical protein CSKR_111315 [Clonorchis sinensis]|uniref:cGMP-dependent protein kinase interacting domain-containing protein n=1 Tax=Clonorchis sinensis TaxID=79923 RepID=A0A8T1N0U9_CLOSI|nr:hypothetical protein CSKR_111315 [Clonorchis sinensis]